MRGLRGSRGQSNFRSGVRQIDGAHCSRLEIADEQTDANGAGFWRHRNGVRDAARARGFVLVLREFLVQNLSVVLQGQALRIEHASGQREVKTANAVFRSTE